jgi:hypothetical protein
MKLELTEKPTYKERNGTTRVGDALRWIVEQGKEVAPELLDIAGTVTGVEGLSKLSDKIKGSTELSEFDKKMLIEQLELDKEEFKAISSRWKSDMTSDSWLSKNVRPLTIAFLTLSTVVLILADSSDSPFSVDNVWVELLKNLLITVYLAYFGSRGVEKFKKISK